MHVYYRHCHTRSKMVLAVSRMSKYLWIQMTQSSTSHKLAAQRMAELHAPSRLHCDACGAWIGYITPLESEPRCYYYCADCVEGYKLEQSSKK